MCYSGFVDRKGTVVVTKPTVRHVSNALSRRSEDAMHIGLSLEPLLLAMIVIVIVEGGAIEKGQGDEHIWTRCDTRPERDTRLKHAWSTP